jgi:valyl-tRNA synthetase
MAEAHQKVCIIVFYLKEEGLLTQIVHRRLHWIKNSQKSDRERHSHFSCTLEIKESTIPRIEQQMKYLHRH